MLSNMVLKAMENANGDALCSPRQSLPKRSRRSPGREKSERWRKGKSVESLMPQSDARRKEQWESAVRRRSALLNSHLAQDRLTHLLREPLESGELVQTQPNFLLRDVLSMRAWFGIMDCVADLGSQTFVEALRHNDGVICPLLDHNRAFLGQKLCACHRTVSSATWDGFLRFCRRISDRDRGNIKPCKPCCRLRGFPSRYVNRGQV